MACDLQICTADDGEGSLLDEILMICGSCELSPGLAPEDEIEPTGLEIPRAWRLEEAIFERRKKGCRKRSVLDAAYASAALDRLKHVHWGPVSFFGPS